MKRINDIIVGGLAGVISGSLVVWVNSNHKMNWTAFACMISILVLIVTVNENRSRFKEDWIARVNVSDADKLIELVSQYIGDYQQYQRFTIEIIMRSAGIFNSGNNDYEIQEKKHLRDGIVFELDSIISQIKLLEIRIIKDVSNDGLFEKIESIKTEMSDFYLPNLELVEDGRSGDENELKDIVRSKCQQQNEITRENIEIIQKKSAKIYRELVAVKQ